MFYGARPNSKGAASGVDSLLVVGCDLFPNAHKQLQDADEKSEYCCTQRRKADLDQLNRAAVKSNSRDKILIVRLTNDPDPQTYPDER